MEEKLRDEIHVLRGVVHVSGIEVYRNRYAASYERSGHELILQLNGTASFPIGYIGSSASVAFDVASVHIHMCGGIGIQGAEHLDKVLHDLFKMISDPVRSALEHPTSDVMISAEELFA